MTVRTDAFTDNATWCQSRIDLSDENGQRSPTTPVKINFRNPDEWPKWRRRFEQFRVAFGMASERRSDRSAPCYTASVRKQKTSSHLPTSVTMTESSTTKSWARWTSSSKFGRHYFRESKIQPANTTQWRNS